jgi:hypothetical protein
MGEASRYSPSFPGISSACFSQQVDYVFQHFTGRPTGQQQVNSILKDHNGFMVSTMNGLQKYDGKNL